MISSNTSYYTSVHFRLSSFTYLLQMVDMFCYELPRQNQSLKKVGENLNPLQLGPTVVYNLQNLISNDRFFIFVTRQAAALRVKSLVDLYPNTNWLEREIGELFGFIFDGKNDTRNLMLQYGDSSAPFKKSYPAIGLKELYYNFATDLISQTPFYTQI